MQLKTFLVPREKKNQRQTTSSSHCFSCVPLLFAKHFDTLSKSGHGTRVYSSFLSVERAQMTVGLTPQCHSPCALPSLSGALFSLMINFNSHPHSGSVGFNSVRQVPALASCVGSLMVPHLGTKTKPPACFHRDSVALKGITGSYCCKPAAVCLTFHLQQSQSTF